MIDKNTTHPVVIEADSETPTHEGEAYPDGLIPEWGSDDDRQHHGRHCRSQKQCKEGAADPGKRVNIGLLVPIEGLRELMVMHGQDALRLFIAEATRDFKKRLCVAIANENISAEFSDSVDVQQEQTGFDLMRRVYGLANAETLPNVVEENIESDGVSNWKGVPGYHWLFTSGTIDAELVKVEAEGGLKAVMQRIGEIIGEQN